MCFIIICDIIQYEKSFFLKWSVSEKIAGKHNLDYSHGFKDKSTCKKSLGKLGGSCPGAIFTLSLHFKQHFFVFYYTHILVYNTLTDLHLYEV